MTGPVGMLLSAGGDGRGSTTGRDSPLERNRLARSRKCRLALGHMRDESKATVPLLIKLLKDENCRVRVAAIRALGKMGPAAKVAVPALTESLKDTAGPEARDARPVRVRGRRYGGRGEVRGHAACALGNIGPEAKSSVPALAELLAANDEEVRRDAAYGLAGIGPEAKAAMPRLIEALSDENLTVRGHACAALGNIGPQAKAAVPALVQRIREVHDHAGVASEVYENVAGVASQALAKIGAGRLPATIALSKEKDWHVRACCQDPRRHAR